MCRKKRELGVEQGWNVSIEKHVRHLHAQAENGSNGMQNFITRSVNESEQQKNSHER